MLKSYVGLATLAGLEVLLPEHELVVNALTALAPPRRAVCCWAVLDGDDALEIDQRIAAGERASALALFEAAAHGSGSILPERVSAD
jgi:hypothetical protein